MSDTPSTATDGTTGTQSLTDRIVDEAAKDARLCILCIMGGEECDECRMAETFGLVLRRALRLTNAIIAPRGSLGHGSAFGKEGAPHV